DRVGNIFDDIGDFLKKPVPSAITSAVLSYIGVGLYANAVQVLSTVTVTSQVAVPLATAAFAVPGMVQGETFSEAYVAAMTKRLLAAARVAGVDAGKEVGAELPPEATQA